MGDSKKLASMVQQFKGLTMEDLIGGPLIAAAKANKQMALNQTRFLMDTFFQKEEKAKGKSGKKVTTTEFKPTMIKLDLVKGAIGKKSEGNNEGSIIGKETSSFEMPLLTVIPIHSITGSMSMEFDMEVKQPIVDGEMIRNSSKKNTTSSSKPPVSIESLISTTLRPTYLSNTKVKHLINCPVCEKGEIHFDFDYFLAGNECSCSTSNCSTAVKLPKSSQHHVNTVVEGLIQNLTKSVSPKKIN